MIIDYTTVCKSILTVAIDVSGVPPFGTDYQSSITLSEYTECSHSLELYIHSYFICKLQDSSFLTKCILEMPHVLTNLEKATSFSNVVSFEFGA